ncbi:MFS transporter [Amycolatopsis taiwanensis]|uniref:MFS transporter n=1 Tax=Amycolatopsis taiwanensis TaxID=342230 RepID=A0A9W6QZP7_9PSEU|nr:MFS transporter [Amycolatopsis taiwanensis]GLY64900.1 MFS transporter [Amycolatopsis taiwanensis]
MTAQARVVAAASIGNGLEWMSFSSYALLADVIARQFFPTTNQVTSLMLTVASIGAAYFIRPVGAIVLGGYADRAGRMPALMIAIRIMVVATFVITFIPDYDTIGVFAPIGMLIAVLLQGFSAGGEFGSATAYLIEQNAGRRGFMGGFQGASQAASTLLATVLLAVLSSTLSPAQFDSWGWRIPFAIGLLLGPVGIYLRRHLKDSPEFLEARAEASAEPEPLRAVVRTQKSRILLTIGVLAVATGFSYLLSYMPTFAIRELGMPTNTSFAATILTGVVLTLCSPLTGHISDKIGRIRMLAAAAVLIFLTSLPFFLLIKSFPSFAVVTVVVTLMGLVKVWYSGPLGALMAEIFPVRTRSTGLSIGYNIGVAIFGGLTPLVVTWLIAVTGSKLAPGFWIMTLAAVSTISILLAGRYVSSAPTPAPAKQPAKEGS